MAIDVEKNHACYLAIMNLVLNSAAEWPNFQLWAEYFRSSIKTTRWMNFQLRAATMQSYGNIISNSPVYVSYLWYIFHIQSKHPPLN